MNKPALLSNNALGQVVMLLQGVTLIVIILYFGRTLFIPLSFALFISFIFYPICKWLEGKGLSRIFAAVIPVFTLLLLGIGAGYLLISQLWDFSQEWKGVKENVINTMGELSVFLADNHYLSAEKQTEMLQKAIDKVSEGAFALVRNTASSISEGLFFLIMVPIFALLMLIYRHKLVNVLFWLFPKESRPSVYDVLLGTIHTYYGFVKGMALVYLIVGVLNSLGLAIIGVPHPVLFGLTASILTFIPYVGIMIASLLPIIVVWVTYNTPWQPIAVVVVFTIVQFLEAYVIFPLAVGKRLKINTLIVFLAIVVGGMLWGAAGMILFIPMVSILKLIADKSPKMSYLSELLGE
jgi:predicted PurR-regulated permease PerM